MNRAEQIQERLAEIEAELAADPPHPPFGTFAYLLWQLDHLEQRKPLSTEQVAALKDERRSLLREYDRLPDHLKRGENA